MISFGVIKNYIFAIKKIKTYMKRVYISLLFLVAHLIALTQNVGISETLITPHSSAILEVRSTNKGILIPRVALTQTTSASPVTSPEGEFTGV